MLLYSDGTTLILSVRQQPAARSPYRVRMTQACGGYPPLPVLYGGGDHRCPASRAISSAPVLASGVPGLSRKPRRADLLLAVGPLTGIVCISMWISCAKRRQACARGVEMLGIPPPGPAHKRAADWENTTRALCMKRKSAIVHTPRREIS